MQHQHDHLKPHTTKAALACVYLEKDSSLPGTEKTGERHATPAHPQTGLQGLSGANA